MSVTELYLVCALWGIAGYMCGRFWRRQELDKLRMQLADMKAMERLTRVINA